MSENTTNQINLKPQEKEEARIETAPQADNTGGINQNPPLIDYMQPEKNKNNMILFGLIAVFGLIIIVLVGYYIFRYFAVQNAIKNNAGLIQQNAANQAAEVEILEEEPENDDSQNPGFTTLPGYMAPEADDSEGILTSPTEIAEYNKNGPKDQLAANTNLKGFNPNNPENGTGQNSVNPNPGSPTAPSEPITTSQAVNKLVAAWKANDYKPGEIKGSTHKVIIGDTLWEISEGKYGQGQQWRKIQSANGVKNLPNGNPLIIPGQNLNLPE